MSIRPYENSAFRVIQPFEFRPFGIRSFVGDPLNSANKRHDHSGLGVLLLMLNFVRLHWIKVVK